MLQIIKKFRQKIYTNLSAKLIEYLFAFSKIIFICCAIFQINCAGLQPRPHLKSAVPIIRILLIEGNDIQLKLLDNYGVEEKNQFKSGLPVDNWLTIKISVIDSGIEIFNSNHRLFSGEKISLIGRDQKSQFQVGDKQYQGNVQLLPRNGRIQVIDFMDVESYVKGVVPAEIGKFEKKEIEALKAQAVASRTFAMKKIELNSKPSNGKDFDVSAGIEDQVFAGTAKRYKWSDLAVDRTYGEVAVYKNTLIHAFYHSTCGGRTEYGNNVFPGEDMPYLIGVADNFGQEDFCKFSPHFRWMESFSFTEIEQSLKAYVNNAQNLINRGLITDIVVDKRYKSGRIEKLDLIFGSMNNKLTLTGNQLRRTIRRPDGTLLRSNLFRVAKSGPKAHPTGIVLIGAGNGHGVGMCQWGAIGMARHGFDYRQILRHYYRGVKIEKIY